MTEITRGPTNLERFKGQLKKDSLAARLVSAQMNPGAMKHQEALKKVVLDRLNELRSGYAGTADQQD